MKLIISITLMMFCLNSCAVYSKGFDCKDARGVPCTMLSQIDRMVDNGSIETVYLEKDKKCKGKNCKINKNIENRPKLEMNRIHKVRIQTSDDIDEYEDGDNLYLK
jgi:hypothetical protein